MGSINVCVPREKEVLLEEHIFVPPSWMDSTGLMLEFKADQAKVVEQFLSSTDMALLGSLAEVMVKYVELEVWVKKRERDDAFKQLPSELQTPSDFFKYPSWVGDSLYALKDIEMAGAGFILSDEDRVEGASRGSGEDPSAPLSLSLGAAP
ncbi:uncharacterized protein A4U43_C04F30720 [Asparagus officinalis]|uniref:Uncharacterized protein n=1 Tax=Asparagus officinalis TaxID=4686 RepID=A0A5P1F4S5_ASPOF|nr:uncharacterized protein A4U43_C04F30720 [Asparagus officinalis]